MPALPLGAIIGDTAAGDQAVDMRVVDQLLGPGVQHSQNADGAANITLVAGQLDDRFACRLHQRRVAVALIGTQQGPQFRWHGDGDVEVRAWQQLGLARGQPALGLITVA